MGALSIFIFSVLGFALAAQAGSLASQSASGPVPSGNVAGTETLLVHPDTSAEHRITPRGFVSKIAEATREGWQSLSTRISGGAEKYSKPQIRVRASALLGGTSSSGEGESAIPASSSKSQKEEGTLKAEESLSTKDGGIKKESVITALNKKEKTRDKAGLEIPPNMAGALSTVAVRTTPLENTGTPTASQEAATEKVIRVEDEWKDPAAAVSVGDIDGNGWEDFAYRTPQENHSRGAIRIYLMSGLRTAHSARHIAPGKWGFKNPDLKHGDRFGTSVVGIGDVNGDGVGDIAVGAPGERSETTSRGAVFIILLKSDASVLSWKAISEDTKADLRGQFTVDERFGGSLKAISDMNGDNVQDILASSADGTLTPLFVSRDGDAKVGVRIPRDLSKLTDEINPLLPSKRQKDLISNKARVLSVEAELQGGTQSPGCRFNDATCHCVLSVSPPEEKECLSFLRDIGNGISLCKRDRCPDVFKCSCDAPMLAICSRKEEDRTSFEVDTEGAKQGKTKNEVPCKQVSRKLVQVSQMQSQSS